VRDVVALLPVAAAYAEGERLFLNAAAEALTGYAAAELPDLDAWFGALGEAGATLARDLYRQALAAPSRATLTVAFPRKDGDVRVLEWVVSAAGTGAIWVLTETAQPLRVEDRRRQSRTLELVGLLAGGVAHVINNNLAAVVANAALLGPRVATLPPDNGDFLAEINEAATRAAGMVRKLLTLSHRHRLARRPLDLGEHLRALVATLEADLPPGIALGVSDLVPSGHTVVADPDALVHVVRNLVANAVDALPGGGTIEVACEEVEHSADDDPVTAEVPSGRFAVVTVTDTGAGMGPEVLSRIFEPFFTTKVPASESNGLGLSTAFVLARLHAGHITVASRPGVGTTVRVWLPLDEAPARRRPAPATGGGGEPGEGILLVDDEIPLRVAAQKVLERLGYQVFTAGDGERALRLFHAHEAEIGLVITDVMMPVLGGRGLYEALRAEGKQVPVVFMSGYVGTDMREEERLDPSVPFLEKPWDIDDLTRVVAELLGPPVA
jgi:two-component system, cell cycle sensor histidine kinase and response regulator CckA